MAFGIPWKPDEREKDNDRKFSKYKMISNFRTTSWEKCVHLCLEGCSVEKSSLLLSTLPTLQSEGILALDTPAGYTNMNTQETTEHALVRQMAVFSGTGMAEPRSTTDMTRCVDIA